MDILAVYIPNAIGEDTLNWNTSHPELIPLPLPSHLIGKQDVTTNLVDMEFKLRQAQAEDSLSELCRLLRVLRGIYQYRHK